MMIMELLGYSVSSIYLFLLIVSGFLIVISLLFSDILSIDLHFINPTLILAFVIIFSASGYLMEKYSFLNSVLILILSAIIAFIIAVCLHFFLFIPLSNAEESLVYDNGSLKGRVGKVITTIPKDGFGEILIESYSGNIAKTAASFYNEEILEGAKTLVIEVKDNIAFVVIHEEI